MSSVSGGVGDLECQTIPIGLKAYPSVPWTWLLGLGMRASAANTYLSQKDAARLLERISLWYVFRYIEVLRYQLKVLGTQGVLLIRKGLSSSENWTSVSFPRTRK